MSELLDNDITKSYKRAHALETSVKYIYFNNDKYESISNFSKKYSLKEGYNEFIKLVNNYYPMNYVYLYMNGKKSINNAVYTEIVDFISLFNISSTYENLDDLKQDYERWYENIYKKEKEITENTYNNILNVQENLKNVIPIKHSKPEITIINKIIEINENLELEDGILIFNESIVNEDIPFIQYVNNDYESFYKIYDNNKYYNFIDDFKIKSVENNYIYIAVCLEPEGKLTKSSFLLFTISIINKTLKIKIDINIFDKAIKIIEKSFPKIIFGKEKETKIKGFFTIEQVIISKSALHFLIITEKLFSNYLYIEESINAVCEKKIITIHYKTFTGYSIENTKSSSVVISFDTNIESIIKDKTDLITVRVNVIKAESLKILNEFIEIFTRLMTIYMENIFNINIHFNESIGNFLPIDKNDDFFENTTNEDKKGRKISNLKLNGGNYFNDADYSRYKCKCHFQPIIIKDDEVEEWRKYQVEKMDRIVKKVPFSLTDLINNTNTTDKYINLVCPNNDIPYLKLTKVEKTDGTITIYPCCSSVMPKNDQEKKEKTRSSYVISTLKILNKDSDQAYIPLSFLNLLSASENINYTPLNYNSFLRKKTQISKLSFLHCILFSIQDPAYLLTNNKEDYCLKIKEQIIEEINENIMKQEMYDFTDDDIYNEFLDESNFLDPYLYYRIFEEYYNLNIFVFSVDSHGNIEPETPRCKDFHIRLKKNDRNESIIILKHKQEKHCELIFYKSSDINKYIYTEEMTNHLFSIFKQSNHNYVFSYTTDFTLRDDPYSFIDYENIFDNIESQFIDKSGKTYGLNVIVKSGDVQEKFSIIIPFSQPLPLPSTKELYRKQTETSILLHFGTPETKTPDGYWYSILDYKHGFFIPIKNNDVQIQQIPYMPNDNHEDLSYIKLRHAKKYTSIFMQYINWLWKLTIKEDSKLSNFDDWWNKYVILDNNMKEQIGVCNFSQILPDFDNVNDALKFIDYKPFFQKNKIKLYSKLYNITYGFFKREENMINGLNYNDFYMTIPKRLDDLYIYEEDFIKNKNNLIIIGNTNLDSWLYGIMNNKNIINIETEFSLDFYKNEEPILFKDVDGKIYIIQNVHAGNIYRALYICNEWYKNKINRGTVSNYIKEFDDWSYIVYGISKENKLVAIDDKTFEEDKYFYQILKYSKESNVYAAMLPLL